MTPDALDRYNAQFEERERRHRTEIEAMGQRIAAGEITPNWELLDAAITHAILHPETFDMGTWIVPAGASPERLNMARYTGNTCGTTACLAGTVLHLSGYRAYWTAPSEDPATWRFHGSVMARPGTPDHGALRGMLGNEDEIRAGHVVYVSIEANRLLAIPYEVQQWVEETGGGSLFYGDDVDDVIRFRNHLADACGQPQRDFAEVHAARAVLDRLATAQDQATAAALLAVQYTDLTPATADGEDTTEGTTTNV